SENLPQPLTHWDSYGQVYGSEGFHILYQCWLDYQSAVEVVYSIYRDGYVLFYQKTLPAMPQRGVSRFFLPAVNTPSGGTPQFNKSISYRISLDSVDGTTQFQFYRDGSRVEIRNLSADQRAAFDQ